MWPNGPTCPPCGNADQAKITSLKGKAHRTGLYQCNECREQFTVTVGTVFERSKIPLTKWPAALFLLTSSKKGISTHQLHRLLGVSYKSTWFMTHRLRQAMRSDGSVPIGGGGGSVEADETYFGKYDEPHERRKKRYYPVTKGGGNTRVALGVDDVARAELAAQGIVGLTYGMPDSTRPAL